MQIIIITHMVVMYSSHNSIFLVLAYKALDTSFSSHFLVTTE